jgi:predicted enzyme related to lactoylglutathione lyase
MSTTPITWFEIPTRDIDAAQRFYEQLLGKAMRRESMGEALLAVFGSPDDAVGGALIDAPGMGAPQAQGTLVYLDAGPSLDAALARATALGGRVATPRTALPPGMGYFAHIIDAEGNRVGLHSLA